MSNHNYNEERFKSLFMFWDLWTGARFERIENPKPSKHTVPFSVCRFNANSRRWEALDEA